MSICETLTYGKRHGFVYLRYIATIFFFLAQIAFYYVVANALIQASAALAGFNSMDVGAIVAALTSFRLDGAFGAVVEVLRSLGALVIPLYFVATISFVLNLNRREIGKIVRRTAFFAGLAVCAEFLIYMVLIGFVAVIVSQLFEKVLTEIPDVSLAIDRIVEALNAKGKFLSVGNGAEAVAAAQEFVTFRLVLVLLRNMPSLNIFLDQLLCLLMCLFLRFRPKWVNSKARLIFYRALGFLPIVYFLAIFVVNGLTRSGIVLPDIFALCVFPARSLPQFLFIGCILLANRFQPIRPLRREEGLEEVRAPKKDYRPARLLGETATVARRRALGTAVFLSVCLLLLCGADLCFRFLPSANNWGLGKSFWAAACVPFLFLFDDRKPTLKRTYGVFNVFYALAIVVIILIYLFF